jgi:hypothetical protein
MKATVDSHDAGSPQYRQVQEVLECEDEAATVEEAANAWRTEAEKLPLSNGNLERFRDAMLAAIAEGWIAVYPPIKAGGSWTMRVLR